MKVIAATYGTEGDARPFAALCRGLIDAGHEARPLADAATLGSAEALGVPVTAPAGGRRPRAEAFARALDFAASAQVRDRARALGETMRAENGVAKAVAVLERIVAG